MTLETTTTVADPAGPQPGPSKELLLSTSFLLKRLGFLVKDRAHAALQETWLTPQHHGVLSILEERQCRAQGDIADALGYDRSQLVGLLDELEEHGLVARRRDREDRRRQLVRITPEGLEALGELRRVAKQVENEFLTPLDADERRALHALLLKLAAQHDVRFAKPTA
jgi:MarR family transcriptional regulator, lower aerobic nicotinate degradation pathway regulator